MTFSAGFTCCPDQFVAPATWRGGVRKSLTRWSSGLRGSTVSHGLSGLPLGPAASFAYATVTGDVQALGLWEEWREGERARETVACQCL